MRRKISVLASVILIAASAAATVHAGDIGHFVAGVPNIRDLALPAPGFYGVVYNYGYMTSRVNDANGNKISSVTIGGDLGPGVTLDVDANVNVYALAPTFIWVANQKVLGGHYGAYFSPTFSNASIGAALSGITDAGRSVNTGQFNIGDIFVQPLWLGWTGKHYDASYGYGFYIPAGKYSTTTVTLPVVGSVKTEAADNIGLGFWTNQNQGSLYLYPWADRRMAIENAFTWEIHQKKRGFDLTPGQDFTWNWGVSQFLPLKKDQSVLLEVGPSGYSSFQVSDDSGTEARNPSVHDRVHAVGVQVGVTAVKKVMALNFHWFHEYSAVDRFQGTAIGVSFTCKF
jgi:hypothetical protein